MGRRQAEVDHVDLRPGQQGVEVPGRERDAVLQGEGVCGRLGAGADPAHLHKASGKHGIIGQVHMGAIPGAGHTDSKSLHGGARLLCNGLGSLTQAMKWKLNGTEVWNAERGRSESRP